MCDYKKASHYKKTRFYSKKREFSRENANVSVKTRFQTEPTAIPHAVFFSEIEIFLKFQREIAIFLSKTRFSDCHLPKKSVI